MPGALMVRDGICRVKTVLVVDDMEIVCRSVKRTLEALGCSVFSAGDGGEALKILAENPRISLVVSDIDMPGMSGLELLRRILAEYKEVRILLMTGNAIPEEKIEESPRFLGILQKPFSKEDLKKYLG